MFEDSSLGLDIALRHWLQAVYLVVSSKKGVSNNQLHRAMGITLRALGS